MPARFKLLSSAFIIIFAAGLLVLPPPLTAAAPKSSTPGPATPKIDFIYPKDFEGVSLAGQGTASPAAKTSRLSVKLYGGYSTVAAADVNDGIDYYFEVIDIYTADGFGTATGGFNPVHGGYDFGADLIYQLSPKFGLGLGFGYMRNSASSVATFSEADIGEVTLTAGATLKAMPIRLGLFFSTPLSARLNLTADAGAAYYAGLKLEATEGLEYSPTEWMKMTVDGSDRSGADIGFHGSLGIEYALSPKLGVFVEAGGRYAKFDNFETVTGLQESSDVRETIQGKLYLVTDSLGSEEISTFTIVEEGGIVDPNAREPKIDLTGFGLRAGIRIRF
jgi:hypothetical protein